MKLSKSLAGSFRSWLKPHQIAAISFGLRRTCFANFGAQRTGKTVAAFGVIAERYDRGEVRNVLVVCPKTVTSVWTRASSRMLRVFSRSRTFEECLRDITSYRTRSQTLSILAIGYEQLVRHVDKVLQCQWDMIIVDESQCIKSPTSRRSKAVHKLRHAAKYKMILSGTPMPQASPLELWSQYCFLSPRMFGDNWKSFREQWCRKAGFMNKQWKLKKHRHKMFMDRVHSLAVRVSKEEAGLIAPEHELVLFDMGSQNQDLYDQLETMFVAYLRDNPDVKATTPLVVTQMLRLQQLTGGWFHADEEEEPIKVGTAKARALRAVIEQRLGGRLGGSRFVVFARFRSEIEDIERVLRALDISYLTLTGSTKDRSVWKLYQDHPQEYRAFVAQISTGGVGIDLYTADAMVFYSKTFSFADYDQALSRADHVDRRKKVSVFHLVARNTIDSYLERILRKKGTTSKHLLDTYRRRTKTWPRVQP